MIHDLKKSPVGRGGLVPSLESLVRDLRLEWKSNITLRVSSGVDLDPDLHLLTYQIVREGLMNAVKHAKASRIIVELAPHETGLLVTVEDDGVGFNPEEVDRSTHFGLGLVEERVERGGGWIKLETGHLKGTRLRAFLPRRASSPES